MSKVNNIFITGGCGFIGTSLISELLKEQPELHIRILDNLTTGTEQDLAEVTNFTRASPECASHMNSGVVFIQGDIRDADLIRKCLHRVECIIHLAANTGVGPSVEDPQQDMESNVVGTFNMLEAARLNGVKKFIFASSGAPAGAVEPPIHEELPPHPVSPYGASKLAGEGYCSAYYRTFGIDTVCLRFGNVYGPRSKKKSSIVAKFIRQALAGETCVIYGDGTQTRDFLYIDDLVQAIMLAIEKPIGGETFQIATGIEKTIDEVANVITTTIAKYGLMMKLLYDEPRLGDVKRNYSDTSKAKRMLGWQTKVEFSTGVAKTLEWFMAHR